MTLTVTFDFNCLVSVENMESGSDELFDLIHLHEKEKITISIPAISANEKLKDGNYLKNFKDFQQRINQLSTRNFVLLKPIAVWGMCFWDWCIWGSDEDFDLLRKIHLVLFPETPYEWGEYAKQKNLDINILDQTWKNHRFDSMTIWSHIKYTNDFFITNDNNFHKQTKKGVLINFGARKILTTSEAFHYLKKSS